MVPEEEQMYAEIGSGQDSGSSSITYAHIEPRELPPVPPTVESLKSVAHAHSRQGGSFLCAFIETFKTVVLVLIIHFPAGIYFRSVSKKILFLFLY